MEYKEIKGNLITLALQGEFDVITHGCNCFCTMGAGIAPQMAKAFDCDIFELEGDEYKGDINKLGQIDSKRLKEYDYGNNQYEWLEFLWDLDSNIKPTGKELIVVNSYTQYKYGRNHSDGVDKPVDYDALTLCLRKINHNFKGKHVGLPQIGCGLAGGDWNIVKNIIQKELKDCKVTVVIFSK